MRIIIDENSCSIFDCYDYKDILNSAGISYSKAKQCYRLKNNNKLFSLKLRRLFYKFKEFEKLTGHKVSFSADKNSIKSLQKFKKSWKKMTEFHEEMKKFKKDKIIDLEGYEFKTLQPYKHQKLSLSFLKKFGLCYLLAECGVGKTFIVLHYLQYLKTIDPDFKMLLLCFPAVISSAWLQDMEKFKINLPYKIFESLAEVEEFRQHPELMKDYNLFFSTFQKFSRKWKTYLKIPFDGCVIDESSRLKNATSNTAKGCIALDKSLNLKYKMELTGTAAPNNLLEFIPQAMFMNMETVGYNFYKIRDEYFNSTGWMGYDYEIDPTTKEDFMDKIFTTAVTIENTEVTLPSQNYHIIKVPTTKAFEKTYKDFIKEKVLSGKDGEKFVSKIQLDEILKLRELTSGFIMKSIPVIDEKSQKIKEERVYEEVHDFKIKALQDLLEELGTNQVIIWGFFKKELEDIHTILSDKSKIIYGDTREDKDQILKDFKDGKFQYLIANYASISHGVNLQFCKYAVWYSLTHSWESYHQANKRIHRIGQNSPVHYYHLLINFTRKMSIDQVIYKVLKKKEKEYRASINMGEKLISGTSTHKDIIDSFNNFEND